MHNGLAGKIARYLSAQSEPQQTMAIAEALNVTRRGVQKAIGALVADGIIVATYGAKRMVWYALAASASMPPAQTDLGAPTSAEPLENRLDRWRRGAWHRRVPTLARRHQSAPRRAARHQTLRYILAPFILTSVGIGAKYYQKDSARRLVMRLSNDVQIPVKVGAPMHHSLPSVGVRPMIRPRQTGNKLMHASELHRLPEPTIQTNADGAALVNIRRLGYGYRVAYHGVMPPKYHGVAFISADEALQYAQACGFAIVALQSE